MPEVERWVSTQNPNFQKPSILVFWDKLLLPSYGFIKTHNAAFEAANLVCFAKQLG